MHFRTPMDVLRCFMMFHPGQTSSCFCPELCNLLILLKKKIQALNSQSFGGQKKSGHPWTICQPFQWIFPMPIAAVLKSSHPVLRGSQPPAGCTIFADQQGQWDNGRSQRFRDRELRGHPHSTFRRLRRRPWCGEVAKCGLSRRWERGVGGSQGNKVFYRV